MDMKKKAYLHPGSPEALKIQAHSFGSNFQNGQFV